MRGSLATSATERTRRRWIGGAALCIAVSLAPLAGVSAADANLATVHSFGLGAPGGAAPFARLLQGDDGNFYGTTTSGGANNAGTLFRLQPDGELRTLYDFGSTANDGQFPQGGLVRGTDGNFYGVTGAGGARGDGTVYRVTPGGAMSVIYSFGAFANDGEAPNELVLASDGNLYGTSFEGGAHGRGTVFRIAGNGASPTASPTLLSFGASASDGIEPTSALALGDDGHLYGTTSRGGIGGKGTVFRATMGGTLTTLHAFSGTNGSGPEAALLLAADGKFYGTTQFGGSFNRGVIYTVTPAGTFAIVHEFPDGPAGGAFPRSGLVAAGTGMIGSTQGGGEHGTGTAYRLDADGAVTLLHSFGATSADGVNPAASPLVAGDGAYYGVTLNGGANGTGIAYRLSVDGVFAKLHDFDASAPIDGSAPSAPLAATSDGTLYGTTQLGGAGAGTVFAISPGGALTTLHSFDASLTEGGNPSAELTVSSDGTVFGVTPNGGQFSAGTLFRITPAGAFGVLRHFGSNTPDPSSPQAGLVLGANGKLYGTSVAGGIYGRGTVFTCDLSGACARLHDFGAVAGDGQAPTARLTLAADGTLYGTTLGGGSAGRGTLFSVSAAGMYTLLHSFGLESGAGHTPAAGVAAAADGSLIGTTRDGGAHDAGTIFRFVPGNTGVSVLYAFGAAESDGRAPDTDLVRGADGAIYGVTAGGGNRNAGILFRVTVGGSYEKLHDFGALAADPRFPFGGLALSPDGNLYGTTSRGGVNGTGAVYRLASGDTTSRGDDADSGGGGGGSVSPGFVVIFLLLSVLRRLRLGQLSNTGLLALRARLWT